jgi:hypothetical protein
MATTAVAYEAIWANAMWPKLSTPVLPMNTCMPSTRMKLLSISAISDSRAGAAAGRVQRGERSHEGDEHGAGHRAAADAEDG